MNRYSRQINLPQVGISGQQKLTDAKVLVVGAGGLGCAILPYLTSAGIGTIGIIDGDTVDETNLHRQTLFSEKDINLNKAKTAADHLKKNNSTVSIETYDAFLNGKNALDIIPKYDLVIDASDNLATRYLINDACVLFDKPFVHGSVHQFEGQVSVCNYQNGPTYRCLFPEANGNVQNCEEAGVLGTTVGLIGMLQANEAMKLILGIGELLSGKLLVYNTLTSSQHIFSFSKKQEPVIDKTFYSAQYLNSYVRNQSITEALQNDITLIDVRETGELPSIEHPNVLKLPLSTLELNLDSLNPENIYAVFCQSGVRSKQAANILKQQQFKSIICITDGAEAISKLLKDEKSIH
ncbi:HesA/MoeB/ThiF family protein [Mangrovimonas sp. DI 80]|uniref:HesA/MoeB/ThiF family protein n=1 Tax=Mangrovimonas sp. DI 80 TaxID=1779330 RepID=UPI0009755B63|nr:HesA/MoeB/ThiF family protein [Mangrovimonas sp. DI 80]OMP30933.1 thiamine biosynthesis protein ThiF [Mangrovimonas sp. DI 80]